MNNGAFFSQEYLCPKDISIIFGCTHSFPSAENVRKRKTDGETEHIDMDKNQNNQNKNSQNKNNQNSQNNQKQNSQNKNNQNSENKK